jgi:hypothetical protein
VDQLSLSFTFLVDALLGQDGGRSGRTLSAQDSTEVAGVARALLLVCLPAQAATAKVQQGSVPPLQSGGGMLPVSERVKMLMNALSVPSVKQQADACMQQPDVAEAALAAAAILTRRVLEAAEGGGQSTPLAEVIVAPTLWALCSAQTIPCRYDSTPGGHGVQRHDGAPPSNATWELLAALPLLARFVIDRCAADRCLAAKAVLGLAAAKPFCAVSSFASCEQVASWMATTEAVLSLLPLMKVEQPVARQAAEGQQQQRPEQGAGGSGALLEHSVLKSFTYMLIFTWRETSKAVCDWAASEAMQRGGDEQREALSALARLLWGLHSTCCRVAHWLLRQPEGQWGIHAEDLLQSSTEALMAALSTHQAARGALEAGSHQQRWAAP